MQKYVNLVDLVKSFPTSIYLQNSASIQPRTSLSKFGGNFNSFFIRLLRRGEPGPDNAGRVPPARRVDRQHADGADAGDGAGGGGQGQAGGAQEARAKAEELLETRKRGVDEEGSGSFLRAVHDWGLLTRGDPPREANFCDARTDGSRRVENDTPRTVC